MAESAGLYSQIYNEDLEPVANTEEVASYQIELQREQEEEQMLADRFNGTDNVMLNIAIIRIIFLIFRCSCSMCKTENVVKKEEVFCCQDIDRCTQKMEEIEGEINCITKHPGFQNVCLDPWVLEAAAIGLRTRKGRRYTVVRAQRQSSESQ